MNALDIQIRRALKSGCDFDFLAAYRVPTRAALLAHAKKTLKERGWTYRAAAPVCKVKFEHFGKVLCGMRDSGVLLQRISEIPPRAETPAETPAETQTETSQAN